MSGTILSRLYGPIRGIYRQLLPDIYTNLKSELFGCQSVLDVGCGRNSPIQYCNVRYKVGIDNFQPYIDESKTKMIHDEYIKADIASIDLESKSFDGIVCIEVLEHLTKDDGYRLLSKLDRIARKKIIITTPNGFIEQDDLDGNPLQKHISSWSAEDFRKLDYHVYGSGGWKCLKKEEAQLKYRPVILFQVLADITNLFVHNHPQYAYTLLIIKTLE